MSDIEWLTNEELGEFPLPDGLCRVIQQRLTNLQPWHVMNAEQTKNKLKGLRERYSAGYVPFAYRQDNDDLACIDPRQPERVVIVHDFATEGSERREQYESFWHWFRAAVEDMIFFE